MLSYMELKLNNTIRYIIKKINPQRKITNKACIFLNEQIMNFIKRFLEYHIEKIICEIEFTESDITDFAYYILSENLKNMYKKQKTFNEDTLTLKGQKMLYKNSINIYNYIKNISISKNIEKLINISIVKNLCCVFEFILKITLHKVDALSNALSPSESIKTITKKNLIFIINNNHDLLELLTRIKVHPINEICNSLDAYSSMISKFIKKPQYKDDLIEYLGYNNLILLIDSITSINKKLNLIIYKNIYL